MRDLRAEDAFQGGLDLCEQAADAVADPGGFAGQVVVGADEHLQLGQGVVTGVNAAQGVRQGTGRIGDHVRKLTEADRLLAEGKDVADVCRALQISEATYHRWRNQFGGLKADDAKRLRELEKENSTLKRLLAEAELEKAALKEIAKGEF
jgi:putative transposase